MGVTRLEPGWAYVDACEQKQRSTTSQKYLYDLLINDFKKFAQAFCSAKYLLISYEIVRYSNQLIVQLNVFRATQAFYF